MIIDLETKENVFHASCTKELNEEEMKQAIEMYLLIKSTINDFDEKD